MLTDAASGARAAPCTVSRDNKRKQQVAMIGFGSVFAMLVAVLVFYM